MILLKEQYHVTSKAIFQDHLNNYAHFQLLKLYDNIGEKEILYNAVRYKDSLGLKESAVVKPLRPYDFLEDYVKFITMNKVILRKVSFLGTCWEYLSDLKKINVNNLKSSIEDLKQRHSSYHREAALVYYNVYQVYSNLKEFSLAKNVFEKMRDLDNVTFCCKREI